MNNKNSELKRLNFEDFLYIFIFFLRNYNSYKKASDEDRYLYTIKV